MEKEKELRDFWCWMQCNYASGYVGEFTGDMVGKYLKSINSAHIEALSVGNNEQAKKPCGKCGYYTHPTDGTCLREGCGNY